VPRLITMIDVSSIHFNSDGLLSRGIVSLEQFGGILNSSTRIMV
jgi:hypothetical protein